MPQKTTTNYVLLSDIPLPLVRGYKAYGANGIEVYYNHPDDDPKAGMRSMRTSSTQALSWLTRNLQALSQQVQELKDFNQLAGE